MTEQTADGVLGDLDRELNGADLLDDVRAWLGTYVLTMHDRDLDLLALWAVHTHLVVETFTTPRLTLDSPVPGSGKTTTLEHMKRLCANPIHAATITSPALLPRLLVNGIRTILIDEVDRSLRPDKEGVQDLLAVINSGYMRGASRPVLVPKRDGGWEEALLPTFAPVAMAGNNPSLPDDTLSRCCRVLLLPDHEGLVEESDWELIEEDAKALGERIANWAEMVRDTVRTTRPPLPDGIRGRMADKWRPLKRVAAVAGGRWPDAVDELAIHDREQLAMNVEDGLVRVKPAVLLLRHMYELWPSGESFWPTSDVLAALTTYHPADWGFDGPFGKPLTAQRLGKMLAQSYGVNSGRLDRVGPRGYARGTFRPVWRRMGITGPEPAPPPRETGASGATGATGAADADVPPWEREGFQESMG